MDDFLYAEPTAMNGRLALPEGSPSSRTRTQGTHHDHHQSQALSRSSRGPAGLLAEAAPADAARPAGMTGDAGNEVLVWGLGNPTSVNAKAAKGKHGKGKIATAAATLVSVREKGSGLPTGVVAHGGQRRGLRMGPSAVQLRGRSAAATRRLVSMTSHVGLPAGITSAGPPRLPKAETRRGAAFQDHGRGGFRTCDLSRVKRALSH